MSYEPSIHELVWDEARVQTFWNHYAQLPSAQETYFAYQVGQGIVRLLNKLVPLRGKRVLDYGCGPGYLVDYLLAAGARCVGVDSSQASIELANRRLEGHPGWEGAFLPSEDSLPFPDASFDLIISVETLEHLFPEKVPTVLRAFHRALVPREGLLWLTTPHNERLEQSQDFCPECQATFHRFQHQSSYDTERLTSLLAAHGFRIHATGATDFARFQPPPRVTPLDWNLRLLLKRSLLLFDAIGEALHVHPSRSMGFPTRGRVGSGPHLFWLGGSIPVEALENFPDNVCPIEIDQTP